MTVVQARPEAPQPSPEEPQGPRTIPRVVLAADRRFRLVVRVAGSSSLVLMGVIALFLLLNASGALSESGPSFFTTHEWQTKTDPKRFGVAAMMYGTVVVAVIALAFAVPVSILGSLFINEVAPRKLKRTLTGLVDLLAAIPSIIYGIWGLLYLQPSLFGTFDWITSHLAFVPVFEPEGRILAGSLFVCGIVVGVMVIPICTSVIREVFSQAPPYEREGALALGSTRWGMIRTVILPFGRGGIVGGSMLGLGRALGETIAVALVLSPTYKIQTHVLEPGGSTVASTIALEFGEATEFGRSALMAAGLALFAVTLAVNFGASLVVSRSRSGSGVEI